MRQLTDYIERKKKNSRPFDFLGGSIRLRENSFLAKKVRKLPSINLNY